MIINRVICEEANFEEKSSSDNFENLKSVRSSRALSRDKLYRNTIFSPHSSSKFSNKTVFSAKKKSLCILPIRNMMNKQKSGFLKKKKIVH